MGQNFYRRPPSLIGLALASVIRPVAPIVLPPAPLPNPPRRYTPGAFGRRNGDAARSRGLNQRLAPAKGPGSYGAWKLQLWAERRAKREQMDAPA